MLTEQDLTTAIVDRLKTWLPLPLSKSVDFWPAKPEQITKDTLAAQHPGGLILVRHTGSEGTDGGMEAVEITAFVIASSPARESKLCRAIKLIVTGLQVPGTQQFRFRKEETITQESGLELRGVSFVTNLPACKVPDGRLAAALAELNLSS